MNFLDAWTLTLLFSDCVELKSFHWCCVDPRDDKISSRGYDDSTINSNRKAKNNITRDGKWAVGVVHIEEEFNIECLGLLGIGGGGHDYDQLVFSIQMHASSFLAQMVAHS